MRSTSLSSSTTRTRAHRVRASTQAPQADSSAPSPARGQRKTIQELSEGALHITVYDLLAHAYDRVAIQYVHDQDVHPHIKRRLRTAPFEAGDLPPAFEHEIVAALLVDSARAMATFFGFEEMNFLVLDHEQHQYRLVVREGVYFPRFQQGTYTQPFGTGMLGLCHMERRTVLYNDVRAAPQYVRTDATVRAELCVPVVLRDTVLAIIDTGASHIDAFTPAHATFIEGFARYLAPAIADPLAFLRMWRPGLVHAPDTLAPLAQSLNFLYSWHDEWRTRFARLYTEAAQRNADLDEKSRMVGALEERNRLARDLHDTLTQSVVSILRVIEGAESEATSPAELRSALIQARTLARQSLDEVRRSVWNLQPAELERHQLPEALRSYAAAWSQQTGVDAYFHLAGKPVQLSSDVEADLLHMTQEALSNVVRHASATHATITLEYTASDLRLTIGDDGAGFVLGASRHDSIVAAVQAQAHGLGLHSMRERIRLLGGQLIIESAVGHGTRVAMRVPALAASESAGESQQRERLPSMLSLPPARPSPDMLEHIHLPHWPPANQYASKTAGERLPVTVLLADDHPTMREGLQMVLAKEPRLRVVGAAASGAEALELTRMLRPDVLLLDVQMPGEDGIAVLRRLRAEGIPARVVMLSVHATDASVAAALRAGARGFLQKDIDTPGLVDAIMKVREGRMAFSPSIAGRLHERAGLLANISAGRLTARESEVLRLLAAGLTYRAIADHLCVSLATVKFHTLNLYQKLQASSRVEALNRGREWGLLT